MPDHASLSFTDPHEYQERIRPAEVQIIPTARGDFRATLSQTALLGLTLQRGWQSLPTAARATLDRSRASIIFHRGTTGAAHRVNGTDLMSDVFVVAAPGEEHFFQVAGDCPWLSLTLTPATYLTAGTTLFGDDFDTTLRTRAIRPQPLAFARLRALHHRIMTLAAAAPNPGAHLEVAKAAEQALLAAVVECMAKDGSDVVRDVGGRTTGVMRRLYELLDDREGLPLSLMDVCARLQVSQRTLYNVCFKHLGLSPRRFLWTRRMQLARRALAQSDSRSRTVTQIAMQFGFWELGRFSVQYKWLLD
jgi:AraC-like DNA-binding protein